MQPMSITMPFSFRKKEQGAVFREFRTLSSGKGYSAPFIRIEAVIIGTHRKKGAS